MKKILIAASLLSPLVLLAQVAAPVAAPAAPAASAMHKQTRSISLQCQQQAALKHLAGLERKQFLVGCINPDLKAAAPAAPAASAAK